MNKILEFEMPEKLTAQQQAAKLRADNPECAALADEMRALFGDGIVVTAMTERGKFTARKFHKPDSEFSVVLDGEQFLRLGRLAKQSANYVQGNAGNDKRK